jgi:hypothetical protein
MLTTEQIYEMREKNIRSSNCVGGDVNDLWVIVCELSKRIDKVEGREHLTHKEHYLLRIKEHEGPWFTHRAINFNDLIPYIKEMVDSENGATFYIERITT